MAINAAERNDVKFLEKAARLKAAQNAEVLKGIMSNAFGREWMYDLLASMSVGATPFSTDALQMSFNCGMQNQGLQILATLQTICPDLYILAMQEHHVRELASASQLARSQDANGGDTSGEWSHHDERASGAGPEGDSPA